MLGRNVDTIIFGVLQHKVFASVRLFGFSAEELGDSMVDVDDVDAGLELFKLWPAPCGPAVGAPTLSPDAKDFGVGEDACGFTAVELHLEAGGGIAFGDDDRGIGPRRSPLPPSRRGDFVGCGPLLSFVAGLDVGFLG